MNLNKNCYAEKEQRTYKPPFASKFTPSIACQSYVLCMMPLSGSFPINIDESLIFFETHCDDMYQSLSKSFGKYTPNQIHEQKPGVSFVPNNINLIKW